MEPLQGPPPPDARQPDPAPPAPTDEPAQPAPRPPGTPPRADHPAGPQAEVAEAPPAPVTVRTLAVVLRAQAVCYVLAAMAAGVAYLVRGPDTLQLGGYADLRTHPVTMLAVGLVVAGLLVLLAHRIPKRPFGLFRLINITELVLLADGLLGVVVGIFNLWWIAGLLVAFAALWYLRAEETERYLD